MIHACHSKFFSQFVARRPRFEATRRLRGQHRYFLNRNILQRREMERPVFLPFRTRSSMSALNLPSSQDSTRVPNNFIVNALNDDFLRREGSRTAAGSNHPRINVSSFFMELTYSTAEPNAFHLLKTSHEGQKRRLEIHATNTINIIKQYCPAKPHKMNQFRCCTRTQRDDVFKFLNVADKPLDALEPTQTKCNTKVLVIIRDSPSGKWNNPFTPYLLGSLAKKHLEPLCITFQSETFLNTLVEQLNDDLHVFPKNTNTNDQTFNAQAKRFLVMSTLTKLVETWSVPLIILDSCLSKLIEWDEVVEFCKKFEIKLIDADSSMVSGNSKQRKTEAKRIRHKVRRALIASNISKVGGDLKRLQQKKSLAGIERTKSKKMFDNIDPSLISEDCRRIVFNLHEKMSMSLEHEKLVQYDGELALTTQISLLEDGILADIENSEAFKCSRSIHTPNSVRTENTLDILDREEIRPKTSTSISDEDLLNHRLALQARFSTTLVREKEKFSELLFNELNQRWRLHGPQRFLARTSDAGPYCSGITESEKQLLLTILQEVTYFETLKDIRNELKDSKKDLEGRLYGYNPDFANLIASAEEFLHGKASCMEPCKDEMQFYKMPVSLVLSEAEVKYIRSKPPAYVVGQESPSHLIRLAIEESTKLFTDAVICKTCGARRLSSSRRNKTKAIVVVEDNNEVLELLTVALWFFEKTPLATFQSKYYYNTSEFLMSLDACRLYFRSYSAHTTKKDEEHVFIRWLGVGMNGVLRSHRNKILLIDFPRPGTNLQNSKNILLNRLKIEEKLNNIKSFIVGKPTRKEDNLSTVEKIMDEIQKALEPRDKLLFRKSRRMYMDLKLYKQIEQKSRQDLKALRDWGLPEPENEHELWEKLRNSDLVMNDVVHATREGSGQLDEQVFESANTESSCCYEDSSEPESTVTDNTERTKRSNSEDVNFLSECEESLESVTVGEENLSANDDIQHYFTTIQFHANRSAGLAGTSTDVTHSHENQSSEESHKEDTETTPKERNSNDLNLQTLEMRHPFRKAKAKHRANMTDKISSTHTLRRSAGALNLLDTHAFEENMSSPKTLQRCDLMNSEIQTTAFTKLEFTLPPKQTSDDEAQSSSSFMSLMAHKPCQETDMTLKNMNAFGEDISNKKGDSNDGFACSDNMKESTKQSKRKGLSELCLNYVSKWGKSLSRAVLKRKPRKSFPEQLSLPLQSSIRKGKSRRSVPPSSSGFAETVDSSPGIWEKETKEKDDMKKESFRNGTSADKDGASNVAWFQNLMGHFRTKTNTRHERAKSKNQNLATD